jgi:HPt (histidine-containing phosphotransfer) domain-containing protein
MPFKSSQSDFSFAQTDGEPFLTSQQRRRMFTRLPLRAVFQAEVQLPALGASFAWRIVRSESRGRSMDSVRALHPSVDLPMDWNDLLARCLGRIDIVDRIVRKFQTTLQADLVQLQRAVRSENTVTIAQIAHRLKGACLAVAAYELRDCAQSLEDSAVNHNLHDLPGRLGDLQEASARFLELSSTLLQQHRAG